MSKEFPLDIELLLRIPVDDKCPECASDNLKWQTINTITGGANQGRLTTSDVTPVFVLGCDDCSEQIHTVPIHELLDEMNKGTKLSLRLSTLR